VTTIVTAAFTAIAECVPTLSRPRITLVLCSVAVSLLDLQSWFTYCIVSFLHHYSLFLCLEGWFM